ncbi:putative pentatricopeptide repeat-containing protein [Iris pallida]|uniref:Pentatricopeptide repeat-containing protein n=1 Tax=Iris pallida TaxID=29817 RepID=A0AAX6H442_IRIPA|nr:putative pentatricopeptide repeat-containing protein [Iris pallida]
MELGSKPLFPSIPLPTQPKPLETFLFSALAAGASLPHLHQAHAVLLRLGLHSSSFLISKLLRRLSEHQPPPPYPHLLSIFSRVPNPNSFLWTTLLRASPEPFAVYSQMRSRSPPPPPLSFTFSALLKSSTSASAGAQVHAHAISLGGFDADLFVQNTLIDFYVRCGGHLDSARRVFDGMPVRDFISWTSLIVAYSKNGEMEPAGEVFERFPEKDRVAWTAMVTGYAQNARPREALETFDRMLAAGVEFDEVTLVGAVSAVAQLGSARHAGWVRGVVDRAGFSSGNVVVGSAMVDMYGKCGLIDEAGLVFESMRQRNVFTFSAMISGLAAHGRAGEAITMFREMVSGTAIKPNWVTFIGLLTACSHAGMVEEGRYYFKQMKDKYGIVPSADHYACMVDLLGRAGLVEEALDMIQSMPVEPHGGVWGALLGACRIHGKTHVARIAAEHLFELEPNCIGNYVLLSNIYASAGMWDEVTQVRKLMRRRKLKKDPASSWMENKDGVVHEFFAGDDKHPMSRKIKEALEEILCRLKLDGYQPVLSSVVYDVSDDEKERLLKGHSEKLALAFGVLTTGTGDTIRIVKNLRTCEDCHMVMKMASKVMQRKIVLRDNLRFHHFQNGECSCGEFW